MRGRVGEVLLGPRVVQPQGFLGRGQLVSLEETLEPQVAPLLQIRHTTVGHPHRRPKLMGVDRLARSFGQDGPEPLAGQHFASQSFELYA